MLESAGGDVPDEDRARLGRRLESSCDVRRIAERDRLRIGASHEPDSCGTAVDPDPNGEAGDPPRGLDVARVAAHDLEDAERRAGCALGVVLVRGRDAEVRADPVALVRLHRSAVLVDRAAHHRHALPDEHLGLVGLEPLAERGRADDVGEEHGDRPALVLDLTWRRPRRRGCVPPATGSRSAAADASGVHGTERVVLAQDRLLELPQLRVGLEPELLVEELPECPIRLESVRVTTGAVERHHEQAAKALVERVETDECLRARRPPRPRVRRRAWPRSAASSASSRSPSRRAISGCANGSEARSASAGPRQSASASARLASASANDSRAKCGLPFGEEPFELVDVDGSGRDTEDVAGLFRGEPAVRRRGASGASRRRPGRCWRPRPAGSSAQSASTSRSRGTTRFRSRRSSARTPRCLSPPSGSRASVIEDLQRPEHSELDQAASSLGDATTVDRAQAVLKRVPKGPFSGACDNGRTGEPTRRRGRWTSIRGRSTRSRGFATRSGCSAPGRRSRERGPPRECRRRGTRRAVDDVVQLAATARRSGRAAVRQGRPV